MRSSARTSDRVELHVGEAGAAGSGPGEAQGRKRGAHRKRRERRPLPGMMLHIDGSDHQWFQDERWHDLIVILDDATSEIYYAQLAEEESTATVMAGLRAVIERKGLFCALYSDRGSHFWLTPKSGRQGRLRAPHAGGPGHEGTGSADDPGLLAAGAGTLGAQLLAPGRDGCRRSCGCARSGLWKRPTSFCGKTTSPSSTAVFRSRQRSGERLLYPAGTGTWKGFSRYTSNAPWIATTRCAFRIWSCSSSGRTGARPWPDAR